MINSMKPGAVGPKEQKGEILNKIADKYGAPEEKQRDPVKKLGKDEFFKLMVTQMQHQDPMKPADHEQMAAQMAQFSALEQMMNVNQNLEKLMTQNAQGGQLGAAGLIGKYVTADSSRITHQEGKPTDMKFELPQDVSKCRISILNEKGENIREIDMDAQKKGEVSFTWDGKRSNKMPAGTGQYMLVVNAEDDKSRPIQVSMLKTEVVSGVGFEGKDTILFVGDPKNPKKMPLRNVSRIVDPSQTGGVAMAAPKGENPLKALLEAKGLPVPGEDDNQEGGAAEGAENPLAALMGGAGAGAAAGAPGMHPQQQVAANENPFQFKINESQNTDAQPGMAAKFTPFAIPGVKLPGMQGVQQEFEEPPKPDALGKDANPAARLAAEGKINARSNRDAVNLRDIPDEDSSPRKAVPSSAEGSIAGQLNE